MEKLGEEYANLALKKFYDMATSNIQTSALVNRALADKISTETINQKVDNQFNSIHYSMNKINPKFNETSKNYGVIKQDILDVLTDYESALTELSDYYDNKLEKLILKKVELESDLIGKVFREENIKKDENIIVKFKEKDDLNSSFSKKVKNLEDKVLEKKRSDSATVEFTDIRKLQDLNDLETEKNNRLDKKISKLQEKNKTNLSEITGLEKEIDKISNEIEKTNETKKLKLEEAMESKEKWVSVTLKKPSVWERTKTFFSYKFNPAKAVSKTVITPLRMKVKEFRVNELDDLKE